MAQRAKALVLDEYGAENGTGRAREVIRALVHHRHDRLLTTIFVSPFSEDEILAKYGDGMLRRALEASGVVIRLG